MIRAVATLSFLLAIVACKAPSNGTAQQGAGDNASVSASAHGAECRSDSACDVGAYCDYAPGLCGQGKKPGTCRPKSAACDQAYAPVCGCDGKTYASECAAHAAGVDLAVMGGCKEPIADWAACGARYCDVRTSYCEIFLSDVFDLPTDSFCRPLPASCLSTDGDGGERTCACFPEGTRCGAFCGPLFTGPKGRTGFHLTCQGKRPPDE